MGCLELLSKFDEFLGFCTETLGEQCVLLVLNYSTCNEFIELLSESVKRHIVEELEEVQYFGLSVHSTHDIAHLDQSTVILRYALSNGSVAEQFVGFVITDSYGAAYLFDTVTKMLKEIGTNFRDCRMQMSNL